MTDKKDDASEEKAAASKPKRFLVRTQTNREVFNALGLEITREGVEVSESKAAELKTLAAISHARIVITEKG